MSIGFVEGRLVFSSGETRVATPVSVDDGRPHRVYLEKDKDRLSLKLDEEETLAVAVQKPIDWQKIKGQDLFMGR